MNPTGTGKFEIQGIDLDVRLSMTGKEVTYATGTAIYKGKEVKVSAYGKGALALRNAQSQTVFATVKVTLERYETANGVGRQRPAFELTTLEIVGVNQNSDADRALAAVASILEEIKGDSKDIVKNRFIGAIAEIRKVVETVAA